MAKKTTNKVTPQTNRVGRPTVMTNDVIAKLELAYTADANNTQACDFAGISEDSLYAYIRKNPDFRDKIECWKQRLKLGAKMNVKNTIADGDKDMSKWYLEKTDNGFNPKQKQELTGKDGNPIEVQSTVQIYLPDNQREDKPKE